MLSFPLDLNAVTFRSGGRRHLFSGASLYLFGIDADTEAVIEAARTAASPEALRAALAGRVPAETVDETIAEIEKLIEAEVLGRFGAPLKPPGRDPGLVGDGVEPTDLWLIVTNSCNLNCAYCFSRAEYMADHVAMTSEIARAGVDRIIALSGAQTDLAIVFFGGEPLLGMPLIREIVAYARTRGAAAGKRFGFAMTTNGVKLTPANRRFLIDERFSVMVSLDGEAAQHDASRPFLSGKGSFATIAPRVRSYVREARAAGLSTSGRTTLNRTHLGHIVDLYRFLDEDMGFTAVSTPIIHEPAPEGFAFRPEDLPALEAELRAVGDLFVERCARDGRAPAWGTITTFLDSLHHRLRPSRGCAAARKAICVDVRGDVYPCERFITARDWILTRTDRDDWAMDRVRALSEIDAVGIYDKCRACEAVWYCKGTCAAERVRYHPPEGPPETTCAIYRALLRVILDVYVRIDRDVVMPPFDPPTAPDARKIAA